MMGVLIPPTDYRSDTDPRTTARRALDRAMSERLWQAEVIDEMRRLKMTMIFHARPALVGPPGNRRMVTNTIAEGVGFPDLVAVHGAVLIALELKSEGKAPHPRQAEWLRSFAALPTGIAMWARPRDRSVLYDVLRRPWAYLPTPTPTPATEGDR